MSLAASMRFFLFLGILFAVPAGFFFAWTEHKTVARLQQRIGPPVRQPFYDFVKLIGKRTPVRHGITAQLLRLYPALSVLALFAALALLPVFPRSQGGFAGDVILFVALIEVPSLCYILAGFTSGSIFARVGARREAALSMANGFVLLLSIILLAIAHGSLRMSELAGLSWNLLHWAGVVGVLLSIPARLRLNPFSNANAEQEICAGPLTDYAGLPLALWELAHALEWLTLTGFLATLILPASLAWWLYAPAFAAACFVQVVLLSAVAAATARFTLQRSLHFHWCAAGFLLVFALGSAAAARFHR